MWAFVSHLVAENLPASILHELSDHSFENYPKFKASFVQLAPQTIELLQRKYLLYTFQLNAARIPHYACFLKKHNINPQEITTVEEFLTKIPQTTKKNYVYTAKDMCEMCINGDYHNISMIVKSSGHSGRQCYWVRSHNEDKFGKTALSIGLDENFQTDKKKTLIINGFILGSWVTGINFNELASWHCPIINVGPNKEEIFQTIIDIGHTFEQIIITGYPPFIKNLVDEGVAQKFPWKKYNVHFIGGGEDFPESWRTYVESMTKGKVRSGFGASDIGILGGMENDDTVFIRRFADTNHDFRRELFGSVEETPMLFQYPLNLFVYANEQKELIFTTILPEATQPVIKYNLQDEGGTLSHETMYALFKKYNISRKIHLPSPFLYIVGRKGGAVNFNAFLIYPENIEECIYRNPSIEKTTTGSFKFQSVFDSKHNRILCIELQLKKGIKPTEKMHKAYVTQIITTLQQVNDGYRISHEKFKEMAVPKVVLYEFEKYPYLDKIKNHYS